MIKKIEENSGLVITYGDEDIARLYGGKDEVFTDFEKCLYAGTETRCFGANNKLQHQKAIVNILMYIKKHILSEHLKGVNVLSELNISKLNAYQNPKAKGFEKDYNIDVIVYNSMGRQTVICAIEVLIDTLDYRTGMKLADLVRNMPGAEVIVVVIYKEARRYKVKLEKYVLNSRGNLECVETPNPGLINGLGLDLGKCKILS